MFRTALMVVTIIVLVFAGGVSQKDTIISFISGQTASANPDTKTPQQKKPKVKVLVTSIQITEDSRTFKAVGTGKARLSAEIHPAVSDEVVDVLFTSQQEVKKGDILVQLDDREEKLALQKAEVTLKDAKSLLSRYEQAVKKGAVPESEVDSARAEYQAAKVAVDQAKLAIEERQIKAPFEGIVGIPNVDPGDRVSSNTLITGLDARDILFVEFEVPEVLSSSLQQPDLTVTATTPAYPDKEFSATISAQESRINAYRRTLTARAQIENTEDLLRPGMSFTIRWEIPGTEYPTAPEISLQWSRAGSYVWIIEDGKAQKAYGRVVARKDGNVLLEADIKSNTPVVVEGVQRLRPNTEVEILEAESE